MVLYRITRKRINENLLQCIKERLFLDIIDLILQKYGNACQLCSPLTKRQSDKARKFLPDELVEILKISNGINEVTENPDTGDIEVINEIIYSLAEIKDQTDCYLGEYGNEGFVFAGNGAGGFFILKPDGRIFAYEYCDLGEELYADCLWDYFNRF